MIITISLHNIVTHITMAGGKGARRQDTKNSGTKCGTRSHVRLPLLLAFLGTRPIKFFKFSEKEPMTSPLPSQIEVEVTVEIHIPGQGTVKLSWADAVDLKLKLDQYIRETKPEKPRETIRVL